MRITAFEKETIINEVKTIFGPGASVYLFGSRVNNMTLGGDLDLFISPISSANPKALYDSKISLSAALKLKLGDQKIDILVKYPNDNRSIIHTASEQGILLC